MSASNPECAVTLVGQLSVNSGSHTATARTRWMLAMPTFSRFAGSLTTATGVTSEPVLAVVGIATTGNTGPGTALSP